MKAFPIANMEGDEEFLGMDLRDYFAAKAMLGMLTGNLDGYILKDLALDAYDMADAMMKARNDN
jgi:hypothetical protein